MELVDIEIKADEMLKNFVDCLGFDGEYYVSSSKCPIMFANIGVPGKFYTAESKTLRSFLSKLDIDDKRKKYILSEGLILVNEKYKVKEVDDQLFITLVHEMLHSGRMILLNTQNRSNENINSIFYNNDRFEQNSGDSSPYYADMAQDIFTGSVDNSRKTINSYNNISNEEKEDMTFFDEKYGGKMYQQQIIDEALVEIMAFVAYELYINKSSNIMEFVKKVPNRYNQVDLTAMSNIILRHNDLELFKWMIDPLTYQNGDVNYDFFSNYLTKDDMDDYSMMMGANNIGIEGIQFVDESSALKKR